MATGNAVRVPDDASPLAVSLQLSLNKRFTERLDALEKRVAELERRPTP